MLGSILFNQELTYSIFLHDHLHRPLVIKDESNEKTVPYKKCLMSLIKMVNAYCLLGRNKLFHIYIYIYIYI